jgi:crossover junction endodeoxyribonuclease RuvC
MNAAAIRIIGIDPGLRNMGWGVIDASGSRLAFVACGSVKSRAGASLAERLCNLHEGLLRVIRELAPVEAAVEETFVNCDPQSALKLGQARGVALVTPALAGLPVSEYSANLIKKTVVGAGHAEKPQVALMVKFLLPKALPESADAADALAVAITHAQLRVSRAMAASLAKSPAKSATPSIAKSVAKSMARSTRG